MKFEYDVSTKDKEMSYINFVDMILFKLGFRVNTLGTKYLRNIIVYIYMKNPFDFYIEKECKSYFEENNIKNINYHSFVQRMDYSIKNVDINKFKSNFEDIFRIDYDIYYLSVKNIVMLVLNLLERNSKNI